MLLCHLQTSLASSDSACQLGCIMEACGTRPALMATGVQARCWAAAYSPTNRRLQLAAPFRASGTRLGNAKRRAVQLCAMGPPRPWATCVAAAATGLGYVRETAHTLPDGMKLELLHLPAASHSASPRPPLLFVHGSYHGAWCWRERWVPFFAAAGYDCFALSLRGQGGSDRKQPDGQQLKVSGDLDSLTDDLAHVVAALPATPVIVAHSFGALLAEKYCTELGCSGGGGRSSSSSGSSARPPLAGVAVVCGVPPTGNKSIITRVFKQSLVLAWKITWAFVAKSFARSLDECRFTFFSEDVPWDDLVRYQQQLAACSPVRLLDLAALNKVLPLPPLSAAARSVPAFVAGGPDDVVVDWPAVEETAAWFGVQPVRWDRTAHDCMLDTRWEAAAASLRQWLDTLPSCGSSRSASA